MRARGVADSTRLAPCHAFTQHHLDGYRCSAEVRGSFQETAPKKTAENTVKLRNGDESSVVVTTLVDNVKMTMTLIDNVKMTQCQDDTSVKMTLVCR